jgi:hypothetical protein
MVGDGHNLQLVVARPIDETEWKALHDVAPKTIVDSRPCIRRGADCLNGSIELEEEQLRNDGITPKVPLPSRLSFI